ncbi:hypothetical protein KAU19_02920 [Candidatus Parcubacteria bacterium]|nr:hypothetical protein [Candidatus Parcubacteria bacterium]
MLYDININAQVESKLSAKELRSQLVIALYDVESQYSKLDGVDDDLEVVDYEITDAIPICPNCDEELIYLEENLVCENCGFGKSALK